MDFNNYLSYVAISFFTITSPGAAILLAINNAINFNLKAVFLSTLGNAIGLFLLSLVAMFGVGVLLKTSAVFFMVLKIVGAGYLIYLGFKQIFNHKMKFAFAKSGAKVHLFDSKKVFQKGFLVAATNPKPILFFSAIFPLFLEQDKSTLLQFCIMTATFIFISFCSLMFYGYLGKRARQLFSDEKRLRIFYRISGVLFIMMGVGMLSISA
ncbi:LysE family translocator [Sulfurospirillum sp. 1612]|uniref:LysE family translocator n=1 Tax=Sulfurospirillum sp. 1612 TaxID=3094835 RepID=UPI002F94C08B